MTGNGPVAWSGELLVPLFDLQHPFKGPQGRAQAFDRHQLLLAQIRQIALRAGQFRLCLPKQLPSLQLGFLLEILGFFLGMSDELDGAALGAGEIIAFLFIIAGIWLFFAGYVIDGLWFGFIGWFLLSSAQSANSEVVLQSMFRGV